MGVELGSVALGLLDSTGTITVRCNNSEEGTLLGSLVGVCHRDTGSIQDNEAVWEELEEVLGFLGQIHAGSCSA